MVERTEVEASPVSHGIGEVALGSRSFVHVLALVVLAVQSVFSISIMVVVPDLARSAVIWFLWLVVATIAFVALIVDHRIRVESRGV